MTANFGRHRAFARDIGSSARELQASGNIITEVNETIGLRKPPGQASSHLEYSNNTVIVLDHEEWPWVLKAIQQGDGVG